MPQIPADRPKAAAPPDAETRSTSETSAPMLDVHAPHESIHTWKGFFIHIATIACGLLAGVWRSRKPWNIFTSAISYRRHGASWPLN